MYLIRLVYASKISEQFTPKDIENILIAARRNNQQHNVTGMLCFHRKYFLQCLEGSRQNVNMIYHKILNDPRHCDARILDYKEIAAREFDEWSMGYIPESSLTQPITLKYSNVAIFDPYDMSGESACLMMMALRDSVPRIS